HTYVAADLPVNILRQFPDDAEKLRPGDRPLLVIENDSSFAEILMDAAHDHGLKVLVATRGAAGVAMARDFMPQVITLDLNLPDMDLPHFVEELKKDETLRDVPVIVYAPGEVPKKLEMQLKRLSQTAPVRDARSPQRLVDATALFLHRDVAKLPTDRRQMIE